MEIRRYIVVAGVIGSVIGYGFNHSQAAIAVIDTQNIAQQAKHLPNPQSLSHRPHSRLHCKLRSLHLFRLISSILIIRALIVA